MIVRDFRVRVWAAALLPTLLFIPILAGFWIHWQQNEMESALQRRAEAIARQLATAAEFHLFSRDTHALQALIDSAIKETPDIVAGAIQDAEGNVLAYGGGAIARQQSFGSAVAWSRLDGGHRSRLHVPIFSNPLPLDDVFFGEDVSAGQAGNRLVGHVLIETTNDSLIHGRNRMVLMGGLSILAAIGLGGALAWLIGRSVTVPLGRIVSVVERIGRGQSDARVETDPNCVLYPLEVGINHMAERVELNQDMLQKQVEMATAVLQAQKQHAEREARQDLLTGLNNRRAFMEQAEQEMLRASRYGGVLSLVIIDLDHFKRVNDTHGHAVGDELLVAFANTLIACMREIDYVGRLGGEEFAILMPGTASEEAVRAAERIRQDVAGMAVETGDTVLRCTASFGVTQFVPDDTHIRDLLIRADRALYAAKENGRNRIEVAEVRAMAPEAKASEVAA